MFHFLFCFLFFSASYLKYTDVKYFDPFVSEKFTLSDDQIADWSVLPLNVSSEVPLSFSSFDKGGHFLLLGSSSLWVQSRVTKSWVRADNQIGFTVSSSTRVFIGDNGRGIIADDSKVVEFSCFETNCKLVSTTEFPIGTVNNIVMDETRGRYLLSASSGLYEFFSEKLLTLFEDDVTFVAVSTGDPATMAFSTRKRLYLADAQEILLIGGSLQNVRYFYIGNVIDNNVTAMAFGINDNSLWVGNDDCVNFYDGILWHRIGGLQGLPYGNITQIVATKEKIYFGHSKGFSSFDLSEMEGLQRPWSYFYGDRWVHGESVLSIDLVNKETKNGHGGVLILTEKGASVFDYKHWTIEHKCSQYEEMVAERHDRYGLVSNVNLEKYGDLSTFKGVYADSEGIWTGIYLAGEIFRYATTGESSAKKNAWKAFEAMELLNNVTGISGYMARTIWPSGIAPDKGEWVNSTTVPDFQFKADTSSDTVTGHMFVYPFFYELVAETGSEKSRVVALVQNFVDNIIKHDYYLIDVDGKTPTRWGNWNPRDLNENEDWKEERGLNSQELLSYLLSAYWMTDDDKYLDHAVELIEKHGYAQNILNQKLEVIDQINHSDDQLGFLSCLGLAHALKKITRLHPAIDGLRENVLRSVGRAYKAIEKENSFFFESIYRYVVQEEDISRSIHGLKTWPQELIDWPTSNEHRIDILHNPERLYCEKKFPPTEAMEVLNFNEITFLRWNGNPYKMDVGGGRAEYSGGPFLFGYWFLRYQGLIIVSEN